MGRFYLGKQEEVRCILDVDVHGVDGEPLCLAYKTTTFHIGAGAYFHDDGYVLKARAWHQDRYYPLDRAEVLVYQSSGTLPNPLPSYVIPFGDYVWGYLLWIVLAGMIAAGAVRRHGETRKRERAERLLAADGAPSDSPVLKTEADSFIQENVAPLLRRDERVLHQAYVVDRDVDSAGVVGALFARGLFVAITTERVILLSTRLGIFGPGLENRGVESIERRSILDCRLDGDGLALDLADGATKRLVMRVNERALSNQRTFARDALRLLALRSEGPPPAPDGAAP
jgi:hypothetical protein